MQFTRNFVPVLSKQDIEQEAENFLKKYYPIALEKPMPIPIEEIVEFQMGLDIDYVGLSEDISILGMMAFSDGIVEIYKRDTDEYVYQQVKRGSMLIESELCNNRGRERFTITHEAVHWDKHQIPFTILNHRAATPLVAYRCLNGYVRRRLKTSEDWLEWQADSITAGILMPKKMFILKAQEFIKQYEQTEIGMLPFEIIEELVVSELSQFFVVSKQAATIRWNNLLVAA